MIVSYIGKKCKNVKIVFYVFYFKIKNAFFNVFLFSQRFLLIKNVGQQFQL